MAGLLSDYSSMCRALSLTSWSFLKPISRGLVFNCLFHQDPPSRFVPIDVYLQLHGCGEGGNRITPFISSYDISHCLYYSFKVLMWSLFMFPLLSSLDCVSLFWFPPTLTLGKVSPSLSYLTFLFLLMNVEKKIYYWPGEIRIGPEESLAFPRGWPSVTRLDPALRSLLPEVVVDNHGSRGVPGLTARCLWASLHSP